MNRNIVAFWCMGISSLVLPADAGTGRTLETGRAAGYYTHSGKGERSARERFERFKSRSASAVVRTPVSVTGEDGRSYEAEVELVDPEAKARAAREAWEKRQGAKARTFVNQAEQEARSKVVSREEEAKALASSMQKLKAAVQAETVDKLLAEKLVDVLSRRVRAGTMSRLEAAKAINYLIANNKVNVAMD
ncbi:MAG: hypothetical protein KHX31_02705 [Akkermansia sp.]|uniref:hypothetical protein n=1 Tax=Akkermansia sp. TaxID=1872421 RepID=UPI0025C63B5B|nr:hypothetical protein [Akkermansia sp.]MBS5507524.1 hypothetical protein [Akkermansia sp.]MCD8065321.1 hypothetical protein [Akkermansia sp.]